MGVEVIGVTGVIEVIEVIVIVVLIGIKIAAIIRTDFEPWVVLNLQEDLTHFKGHTKRSSTELKETGSYKLFYSGAGFRNV